MFLRLFTHCHSVCVKCPSQSGSKAVLSCSLLKSTLHVMQFIKREREREREERTEEQEVKKRKSMCDDLSCNAVKCFTSPREIHLLPHAKRERERKSHILH